jgi:hypothetical protein
MRKLADEIRLMGLSLEEGTTLPNSVCPECNGGQTNEKSFSLTRIPEGFVYNCYRASCDCGGFVPAKGSKLVQTNSKDKGTKKGGKKSRKRSNFRKATTNLSKEQTEFLQGRFTLTDNELQNAAIRWCPTTFSYIVPIYDHNGYKVGVIDRSWTGRVPKTVNHWNSDAANLYFPRPLHAVKEETPVVIVEDFLSAIKVNRIHPCVALLGTNLGLAEATLLRSISKKLVIALDPDATSKALKLSKQYSLLFDRVSVLALDKDPKDMDGAQLRNWFSRNF